MMLTNKIKIKNRRLVTLGLSFVMLLSLLSPTAQAEEGGSEIRVIYVDKNGSDSNTGTKEQPFKTLEAARDKIRALKNETGLPDNGIKVYLREGEYFLDHSFQLGEQDSGEEDKPIVYSAYPGEEVQILGGVSLSSNQFMPVTDEEVRSRLPEAARDHIVQFNLNDLGITDFGEIRQGGFGPFENIVNPELFFNDEALALSRYPNDGYVRTGEITVEGGFPRGDGPAPPSDDIIEEEFKKGHTFKYDDPRPEQWLNNGDIWMQGFFYWDWADGNLNIKNINQETKEISTATASWYGIRSNQRYYYYNILEETDRPGEWYLDRETGMLYLYPPTDLDQANIKLSLLDEPLFLLDGASHITIENVEMGYTRGTAVQILDGTYNTVAGSEIRQTGGFGVTIGDQESGSRGGQHNGVLSSDISDTGIGGIYLAGGDRQTLTRGENYAENNNIYAFSRIKRTYSPAVQLAGVGNNVVHNYFHDAPHQAIAIKGNNHLIEYNEIYNVLTETGDSGAIYMGRDWSEQGNIIRYNYLHKLRNDQSYDQVGIYLDDMASGTTMYGNLLVDVYRPFLIGGGRSNDVQRNVMIEGTQSIYIDNRAMGWAWETAKPGGLMEGLLKEMPYQQEPWSTQYPNLVNILNDEQEVPKYNVVKENVVYDTQNNLEINEHARSNGTVQDNLFIRKNEGISESDKLNQYEEIINVLPVEEFGLYNDHYRHDVIERQYIEALTAMDEDIKNNGGSGDIEGNIPDGYTEDFAQGLGQWSIGDGHPTTSAEQAKSGDQSVLISGDREYMTLRTSEPMQRNVNIWFYDDASDKELAVVARVDDSERHIALGVNTRITEDHYVFRIGADWYPTDIPRTDGWHQLTFDYRSGNGVTLSIDDTPIQTTSGITHFDHLLLGDQWADDQSGRVFFDDVTISGIEVDKSQLDALLSEAKGLDTAGKTEESVKTLEEAIVAAEEVFNNDEATQKAVDTKMASLQAAMEGLKDVIVQRPNNLEATNVTTDSITLTWDEVTTENSVIYQVFINEEMHAKVLANEYTVEDLKPDTTYAFYIVAENEEGIESEKSATISVTTYTSIKQVQEIIQAFYEAGDIKHSLYKQLTNKLKQAQHHQDRDNDKQKIKFLEDSLRFLDKDQAVSDDIKKVIQHKIQKIVQQQT
ncbi:hypothetical protein G4V62_07995 [Bacillaceae bacterium SIJ1]|uniref:FIMAH domain-containing protein n=1 Tax=Litoribacterium kuwaitense TaxID=1398745 RepID=UPI0013EE2F83|nr:right-handed parallel beta-helix repeat-containing protein [Litoribacterium kuwaitense]NGP44903.1 hypothetical protein [Litoribacterium kuwaitense]